MSTGDDWKCVFCKRPYEKYQGRCEGCGKSNALRRGGIDTPSRWTSTGYSVSKDRVEVSRIQHRVDEKPRIRTGIESVNTAFNGGLPVGSTTVLHGLPGSGKSTFALLCADAAAESSAVIASEEDQEQIELRATRTRRALGVSIVCSRNLPAALRAIGSPKLLVVDSLHGCTGRPEANARLIASWAKDTGGAALVVARETKSGSIRGGSDIGYEFDAECTLEIGENDSRFLDVVKFRFGPTGQHPLVLSEYGWSDPPPGSKPIPRPVTTGQLLYLPVPVPPGTTPPWTPRARRERAKPRR